MLPGEGWYLAAVLIAQCVASFLVWVCFGVIRRHGSEATREKIAGIPRARRAVFGAAMLVYGAVCLLGGLCIVEALGGLGPSRLKIWAWIAVTAIGLEFVRAQMVGAAAMLACINEDDTRAQPESSMIQREEEPEP